MAIQIALLIFAIYLVVGFNLKQLSRVLYRIFKEHDTMIWWLSFLFLPGTFLHEIGHLLFAEFLFVRTDDLNVIPQILSDGMIKLGGVQIEHTDKIRRTIIGLAPILFGVLLLSLGTYFRLQLIDNWYYLVFYGYLLIQITHTMFSSKKDLEGVVWGILLMAILFVVGRLLVQFVPTAITSFVGNKVGVYIGNNLIFMRDGLFYGFVADIAIAILLLILTRVFRA